jgi:pilus assembly protein FimV
MAPAPSYQAAAPQAAPAEPTPAPTPAPEPTPTPVEPAPQEPAAAATPPPEVAQAPVETPPPAAEAPPPTAETTPTPAPTPAPEPVETQPTPQPAAAPPKPDEPGLLAEVLDRGRELAANPLAIPVAAGIFVLLVLVFAGRKAADKFAKWRYERASRPQVAPMASAAPGSEDVTQVAESPSMQSALDEAASGVDSTMTMGAAPAVEATQAMGEQTLQQTMQQTQVQEPALAQSGKVDFDVTGAFASETVQINLDAGDPVSEAEFHRAYGLYDEAALLLKQALQKDPKRTDAKVKLAEIYFEANKPNEFTEVAKELKAQLPDPEWQKIALLGSQIAPNEELFKGGGGVSVAGGVDLSFDEPVAAPAAAPPAPAAAPAAAAPAADLGLDFKFDEVQLPDTPAAPPSAPAAPAEGGLEFDLGSLSLDTPAAPAEAAPAAPAAPADEKLELGDFDLSAPAAGGSEEVVELSSDLSTEAPAGAGDESSTKLDLARAYIDMGDSDMAKSLLNEVAQQGNAEQQKEAQELLKRVAG